MIYITLKTSGLRGSKALRYIPVEWNPLVLWTFVTGSFIFEDPVFVALEGRFYIEKFFRCAKKITEIIFFPKNYDFQKKNPKILKLCITIK